MSDSNLIKEYDKIGGWLILVGINVALAPLSYFNNINDNLQLYSPNTWDKLINNHPLWSVAINLETFSSILFFVFSIVLCITFFSKKSYFPRLFIIYKVSYFIMVIIIYFIAVKIPTIANRNDIGKIIVLGLNCVIWIWYFIKSKRVKGTFIR